MKIIITGANGRVGKKLIEHLSYQNEVVGIDRAIDEHLLNIKSYKADITKIDEIENIIKSEQPDAIIHLAAILGPACENNADLAYQINVLATKNLVNLADKYNIRKFVFASTSAVYNQKSVEPTSESQNIDPQSVYGKTKLQAEEEIRELVKKNTALKCIILRMFNIYGSEFSESLINKLIDSNEHSPITVLGPSNFIRDYIHINDVVKAFELALLAEMEEQIEILNIGSGKATSNEELISLVKKSFPKISYQLKPCSLSISWANIYKSKNLLKFSPSVEIII
jgi:nucleoside-diphosphate-sugar epimerase